ncbi:MAG: cytochrome c biogenesis protein CcsA [Verrucomicrobiota bacterium JB023]|nr:cytochrome c biogenesis protein CcsA [Verrucomicrobiota bacterium JB023]
MKTSIGRWIAFALAGIFLLGLFVYGVRGLSPQKTGLVIDEYEEWSDEVLAAAREIPVQEGGRVKPLDTQAHYAMLKLRGDRKIKIENGQGEKVVITPMALMLDMLFRPEIAHRLPVFRVENSEILEAVGLEFPDRGKRDRYSFDELKEKMSAFMERAGDFQARKQRRETLSPVEEQTISLASNLRDYYYLTHYLDFARNKVELSVVEGEGKKVPMSVVMAVKEMIAEAIRESQQNGEELPTHVQDFLAQIQQATMNSSFGLHPFPPYARDEKEWSSAGELLQGTITGQITEVGKAIEDVKSLETLVAAAGGGDFAKELKAFGERTSARASEGEMRPLRWELSYQKAGWIKNALYCFGFGTLAALFSLLAPKTKASSILRLTVWILTSAGLLLFFAAIVHRYLVVLRPPVTTLYETIPFITACSVAVALFVEGITRRGLALGVAPVLGLGGAVLALVFEVSNATDSLDPLVAVLRSNFWLTTHVLTITFGYAAGLLAAAFSAVYILCRLLGLDRESPDLRRTLTRISYGVVCFALLLSMVGTILGGIWANYSWGRFWGWDPKENGALMIVLWTLVILHGRFAGLLREWGIHLATVFLAIVVTFSWFHVNMLGTGLHSYGFMEGKNKIFFFYGAISALMLTGFIGSLVLDRKPRKKSETDDLSPAKPQEA